MAELVLGVGVPHTPYFPRDAERNPTGRVAALFERVRQDLDAARPDVLLVVSSDHFVQYFYDNMPAFAVGIVDEAEGPQENTRDMPYYTVPGSAAVGRGLLRHGLDAGFDLASSEAVRLDHSIMVPLHFLTPQMQVPIVPLYVKGLVTPLPRARRAYDLGRMLRRFVDRWPGHERVAVVASGSISLTVGGPKMGYIDQDWLDTVVDRLREGDARGLARRATEKRMLASGNTGGELLCWLTLAGAMGDARPTWIEPDVQPPQDPRDAHAYGVWAGR
jgi:aromatic ring-opening dioxygenase catalytic subunit (LigB family)